jgi:hypothetical protein
MLVILLDRDCHHKRGRGAQGRDEVDGSYFHFWQRVLPGVLEQVGSEAQPLCCRISTVPHFLCVGKRLVRWTGPPIGDVPLEEDRGDSGLPVGVMDDAQVRRLRPNRKCIGSTISQTQAGRPFFSYAKPFIHCRATGSGSHCRADSRLFGETSSPTSLSVCPRLRAGGGQAGHATLYGAIVADGRS